MAWATANTPPKPPNRSNPPHPNPENPKIPKIPILTTPFHLCYDITHQQPPHPLKRQQHGANGLRQAPHVRGHGLDGGDDEQRGDPGPPTCAATARRDTLTRRYGRRPPTRAATANTPPPKTPNRSNRPHPHPENPKIPKILILTNPTRNHHTPQIRRQRAGPPAPPPPPGPPRCRPRLRLRPIRRRREPRTGAIPLTPILKIPKSPKS